MTPYDQGRAAGYDADPYRPKAINPYAIVHDTPYAIVRNGALVDARCDQWRQGFSDGQTQRSADHDRDNAFYPQN